MGTKNIKSNTTIHIILYLFILLSTVFANPNRAAADDQYEWKSVKSGVNILSSLAYGDNKLVAVGWNGNVVISQNNADDWLKVNSGIKESLEKVIWGNNQFVTVGGAGGIYTSPDGIKWTNAFSMPNCTFQGITWANDCYVAIGYGLGKGIIVNSADGVNWKAVDSGTGDRLVDVVWGNNEFVAIGSETILSSKDGKVWANKNVKGKFLRLETIAWGDKGYVAGGMGSMSMLISEDGTDWIDKVPPTPRFNKIIWADGKYIGTMMSPIVGTSNDGINWTNIFALSAGNMKDIILVDNKLIGIGDSSTIYIGTKIELEEDLSNTVNVKVDGKSIEFPDIKPFVDKNNRTLVPVRFIAEALGADVEWVSETSTVLIRKGNANISLKIGDKTAKVGVKKVPLDSPGRIINERTMVPLRFVAEFLNSKVEWDGNDKVVKITNRDSDETDNSIKEEIVETVDEFIKAIGSNKRILLKTGIYDLSRVKQIDSSDNTLVWMQVSDGKELCIQNISNLTIEGLEGATVIISTATGFANTLKFYNTNNITIINIDVRHTPSKILGGGGALSFNNSNDITIFNSSLSGGGGTGIFLNNVKRLNMSNTNIVNYDYFTVIIIYNSESVSFKLTKIVNHGIENQVLYVYNSTGVVFDECNFSNNKINDLYFANITGKSDVLINKCQITNIINSINENLKSKESYFFKTVDSEGKCDSKVTVKDSKITNSNLNYLTDSIGSVIFENSISTNCAWDR